MHAEKLILVTTVLAVAALQRFRFASFAGAVPAAGQRVLGVAVANFDAGEQAAVAAQGEILVEAGGAIAAGELVQSDALGRAVPHAGAGIAFGAARDAAAAGDIIRVLA